MKSMSSWIRLTAAMATLAGLAACADPPNAPVAASQTAAVAASFDALAQEEAVAGALDRSDDWRWVAKALREGAQPSRIEIWTYGKMEAYNAFVRAIEVPAGINTGPQREPGHLMLAWQRDGSELVNHAVRLWSPGDMGRIVPHAGVHSEVVGGAHVDYLERGEALSPWMGLNGVAQIGERWAGGRCEIKPPPQVEVKLPEGMICQKAHFAVRFEAKFRSMSEQVAPESNTMTMWMAEQKVVGVKFTPAN